MARVPYDAQEMAHILASVRRQLGMPGLASSDNADIEAAVTLCKEDWSALLACVDWLRDRAEPKKKSADREGVAYEVSRLADFEAVIEKLRAARRNGEPISKAEAIARVGRTSTSRHFYEVQSELREYRELLNGFGLTDPELTEILAPLDSE